MLSCSFQNRLDTNKFNLILNIQCEARTQFLVDYLITSNVFHRLLIQEIIKEKEQQHLRLHESSKRKTRSKRIVAVERKE